MSVAQREDGRVSVAQREEGRVSVAQGVTGRAASAGCLVGCDPASHDVLREYAAAVAGAIAVALDDPRPFSGADPKTLAATIDAIDPCPEAGVPFEDVLAQVGDDVLAHGVRVGHPLCAAHLQPPTLAAAAAAELAIGATNQSLDSFEGSPAATLVEDRLVRWLAATLGLAGGSGVLTSGGTAANLRGLLLARERAGARAGCGPGDGLPPQAARWRIVTSLAAHDSVRRAARVLGLGERAVVEVAVDEGGRMDVGALDAALASLEADGLIPIAIVATAGTTDLGAIDPLAAIADRARGCGAWLHVDAAVGSALALSGRLAPLLDGIERADSITADLHKLWFMPIGASALLVRDAGAFAASPNHSDYLNRPEDEADGMLNLVGRSLDTSRRFDALKILVGLRCTGRRRLAAMVEGLVELARTAGELVAAHDELELLAVPSTVMVVFRWRPSDGGLGEEALDAANVAAQRALLRSGRAVIGRTRVGGRVALKLTLVNPNARGDDVRELLELVVGAATSAAQSVGSPAKARARAVGSPAKARAGAVGSPAKARARAVGSPAKARARAVGSAAKTRAREAAVAAASETLLNCWLREGGSWRVAPAAELPEHARPGDSHVAVLALRGAELVAGVRYRSATGRHRFRTPVTLVAGGEHSQPDLGTLAGLLIDDLAGAAASRDREAQAALDRIQASVDNVATFLEARDAEIGTLWGPEPLGFVASEQALLIGHMLHPTPKSRTEMRVADVAAYSPELRARFALHWLAVEPGIVEHDSATGTPAPAIAERLLRDDPACGDRMLDAALAGLGERVLVPAHPWELAHLRDSDPAVAALLRSGAIVDLGALGSPVTPTTSLRTVACEGWPYQLKFSLHVRVTNSMRVTLPKELRRAVEAARLLQTGVGERAAKLAPQFTMLQDPSYLAVRHDGRIVDGLSVLLRDNRWPAGSDADVSAVTTLCQDHPYGGRSRLGQIVAAIARREDRAEPEVAREWFARWCEVVIVPILRLFGELGLCMEPHQQNVLVELDDGWPVRGVYRDSQGYFHREAAHADMVAIVPGIGEASESIFPEALADERLVYYPFVNNALGVVNALGVAGCADERVLLRDLRALLERERDRGARYPATLLGHLLDDATWPCKANLRTRMGDLDELAGDFAEQSVYVTIPNPLAGL